MTTEVSRRKWRMGMLLAAVAAVLSLVMLLMTGLFVFTWIGALAIVASAVAAVATWAGSA